MKTVKMYLLRRENQDDDYIGVCDGNINVHSSFLRNMWSDPTKINFSSFSFPYTLETYYGDSTILESATLLWEHEVE